MSTQQPLCGTVSMVKARDDGSASIAIEIPATLTTGEQYAPDGRLSDASQQARARVKQLAGHLVRVSLEPAGQ